VLDVLTITLPIPFQVQSPNNTPHWSKKSGPVATSRLLAKLAATDIMNRMNVWNPPRWKEAETMAVFYYETNRRRDRDNSGASLKAYWDGIADAGVVENDSGFIHHPPELLVDKERPRVELTLREYVQPVSQ
jgi:Holliday junction resolvase RusA-like endonuclease